MYESIYVAVDNSPLSTSGVDAGVLLAKSFDARLVGSHVYAAKLHDRRFRQMEGGLPEQFRQETELKRQRGVHDDLIAKGLALITSSYLDVFEKRCREAGIPCEPRSLEGKHHIELRKDIEKLESDLVIIGALGLGAVGESVIGSVCERVVRHIAVDALVIKNDFRPRGDARCRPLLTVAIDGSERSFGGLVTALEMSARLDLDVEAVAAFDPFFHTVAFRSIAGVLSKEAGQVFRFKEQEKLHEEIIDSGLAKIYQAQLNTAAKIAEERGRRIETKLLAGKAFSKLLEHLHESKPWAIVLGRNGLHAGGDGELGSTTENLLRLARCNVLLSTSRFAPPVEKIAEETTSFTNEAEERMTRVPPFVKGMARKAILDFAHREGHTVITSDVVDKAMASILPPSAREAMGMIAKAPASPAPDQPLSWSVKASARLSRVPAGMMRDAIEERAMELSKKRSLAKVTLDVVEEVLSEGRRRMESVMGEMGAPSRCPFAAAAPAKAPLAWAPEAEMRLQAVPEGFMREMTRSRVEAFARSHGHAEVTLDAVESKLAQWQDASQKVAPAMTWHPEAWERVLRIPEVVRGQVVKETESYARGRGQAEITGPFYDDVARRFSGGMEFHQRARAESRAIELPASFIEWQLESRRSMFDRIGKRHPIDFFAAHLPVVSTVRKDGRFPIHSGNKGTGFLPKDEHLDHYLARINACLAGLQGRSSEETAGERLAVARELYGRPERIDFRKLGLLEIFKGQTYRNLCESPEATLLYTASGPDWKSWQVNCEAEIVGPEDPRLRFLLGMRMLFEYERFHVHQPAYTLGYVFWVREVIDKSPFHGRAGKKADP